MNRFPDYVAWCSMCLPSVWVNSFELIFLPSELFWKGYEMSSYLSKNCLFTKLHIVWSCHAALCQSFWNFIICFMPAKWCIKEQKKIASLIIFFSFSCTTFNLDKSSKFNASSNTCCFNERQFSKKKLDLCGFQQQQQEHLI